jgi:copper(I)-binding protein
MKNRHIAPLMTTLAALVIQPASAQIVDSAPALQLIVAGKPAAQASAHYMAGEIMIEQPWSPATPRGAPTAAAYMTIMNHGASADTLTGGSSPAGKLELHEMSMTNGIMSMRPVAGGLPIPAGGTVTLNPQGKYHFMLTGLKAPLSEGERVPAVLTFAKAGAVKIELAVAPIGARAPAAASAMPGMDHH